MSRKRRVSAAAQYVYVLTDERGMDPDQFADAQVYSVGPTLADARRDRGESGCGVIVKCRVVDNGVVEWEAYIP